MANPTGESKGEALRLDFDRRLTLQFRGLIVTSDAGLLAYRELDDALGLSSMAGERVADARTGKIARHALVGMLRQSVFGRLTEYEDVNDAERLRHDPAMRWIVGGNATSGCAASARHCQTKFGSVATILAHDARGAVGELSPPDRSCGAVEQVGDDDGLAPDIMTVNLSKLSLPHHRHRFETRQSSPRGMETAEAEPRPDKALDTPVVLLDDVVEVFALPQTGAAR
jgi:Transposase DDE domain group 1